MLPLHAYPARRNRLWSASILACLALAPVAHAATARVVTQVAPPASAAGLPPRLVRLDCASGLTPEALIAAGIDVIESRPGAYCMALEWPGDAARLAGLGARVEVVDETPGRTVVERARRDLALHPATAGKRVMSATDATGRFRAQTLPAFGAGSLVGFWNLDEVKMKLDDLVASDVHDVVADRVDTIGITIQGRPIWGLRLGKTVSGPDTRPVAFYNALTHAREPEGMQALFYFVDDLLSRYGADPAATYLLDHRVLYIVPVVNPDGYRFNQENYDSLAFAGFHRKNLRDTNGDGISQIETDGVDLNRNYGFLWGGPGAGTSVTDVTYRGTGPFSEPETQAQRDLVIALQPKVGLSFHTYGDLMIHPWGFQTDAASDSLKFYEWSDDMTRGNGYQSGQATRVLYQVSGEFTDWCWGDEASKPRFPAWTPEVGNPVDGFWPIPSRILPLAQENLRECYYTAFIAGPYVRVESSSLLEGALDQGSIAHLTLRARNKGLAAAGPGLTATLSPLSAGAHVPQPTISLPALGSFQSGDPLDNGRFVISADDTVTLGRVLQFQVDFTTPAESGGLFSRDTIEVLCGTPTVLMADDGTLGTTQWSTTHNTWNVESDDVYRSGPFLADSPSGLETYANNADARMTTLSPLNLSKGVHAYLAFTGRWEFETDLDCGTVETNLSGNTWTPMPGTGTTRGQGSSSSKQPVGLPCYDGARRFWSPERVDLSSVTGPTMTAVNLRFRVQSSAAPVFDGFRLDDIRVLTFDPAAQPAPVAVEGDGPSPPALELAPPAPNPAHGLTRLDFALPRPSRVRLEVLDLQGRRVRSLADREFPAGRWALGWDLRGAGGQPAGAGVYLVRLATPGRTLVRRLVVLR